MADFEGKYDGAKDSIRGPPSKVRDLNADEEASATAEAEELAHLGYKQELKRGFNGFMSFAFCFDAVSVLPSLSLTYDFGLITGGPAFMVYQWICVFTFVVIAGLCMGEICSKYPSAGSVYYWAAQLASPKWHPLASYVTGWFNLLGSLAATASFARGSAQMFSALSVANGGEALTNQVMVGISIGVMVAYSVINLLNVRIQGYINIFCAMTQIFGCVIICIVLIALSGKNRNSAEFVFATTNNSTGLDVGWGYIALIGFLTPLFSSTGYDAGAHMAEETRDPARAAPRGILLCCTVSAISGFIYMLGLLFSTQDIDRAITTPTGSAAVQVYLDVAGQTGGLILAIILTMTVFLAGLAICTVTTRIAYALVRDDALPFSKTFYKVNAETGVPHGTVVLTFIICTLMLLLPLVNVTAFRAVMSMTSCGLQMSYAVPILMRLIFSRNSFKPGPFNLGSFSIPLNILACFWLVFSSILLLLPATGPITAETFNYSPVVVGGLAIIGCFHWTIFARHTFTGPKRAQVD